MTAAASPAPLLSVRGTIAALRVPTAQDLLFSVKAALAVVLSVLIGFSQQLENPYWSALTVYVLVSQPAAGAVRSKALFRLVGTVLGAIVAVLLAALFASHVGVLLIATIVAVLITFYAKSLDRTPVSYTWFSAALTIAVVSISQVQVPDTIFAVAMTRTAEICLAILMTLLVDSVFLPSAATPAFCNAMGKWSAEAADWAAAVLVAHPAEGSEARLARRKGLHKLTALLASLDAASVQLPYDIVPVPPRPRDLRFLRLTVGHVIAHLASANVWIDAARHASPDSTAAADMERLTSEVREWLAERPASAAVATHAERGDTLAQRISAAAGSMALPGSRDAVLRATTLQRLSELVVHWSRFERTLHAVVTGSRLPKALVPIAMAAKPVRSTDHVLGLLDVAPMALAFGFLATVWYVTTWTASIPAMLFVFISLGFILGTPGAMRSAKGICVWISITCAITLVYQFAVLPRVTSFPVLVAVLLVALLPLGVIVLMSPAAVLILANGFAFLGLQNAYAADFGITLENLLGSMAGCLIAVAALHLCRFDRSRFRARRLAWSMRRDLVETARGSRITSYDRLLSLSVDRMALFFALVDAFPEDDALRSQDPVEIFQIATNLGRLRSEEPALSATAVKRIDALRLAIADEYDGGGRQRLGRLQACIEDTYDVLLTLPRSEPRGRALAALTGLTVSLSLERGR